MQSGRSSARAPSAHGERAPQGQISNDQAKAIQESLARTAETVTKERDELIGPTLGKELRDKALIAFVIAVGAQMVYLALRFRWTYASAAVLSMVHVVLTVVGVFAWLGKPVDACFSPPCSRSSASPSTTPSWCSTGSENALAEPKEISATPSTRRLADTPAHPEHRPRRHLDPRHTRDRGR